MNETLQERSNEAIQNEGKLLTSNKAKAKAFQKHYLKVSSGASKIKKINHINRNIDPFAFEEFEDAARTIDKQKAPGPDCIDCILAEFILHMEKSNHYTSSQTRQIFK